MVKISNSVENIHLAVIGLGYVGLPLAIEFGKKYDVLGFDINKERVKELAAGADRTREANMEDLTAVIALKAGKKSDIGLSFSSNVEDLKKYNTFIVTVPTPIDAYKAPDLRPLIKASEMLGSILKKGDLVIYESTVYPGCTEEDCVPVLEKVSGLKYNTDFFVGYSPERINPGDKVNTLTKIKKVTSGSTPEIADKVDALYGSIIEAGTHKAPSLKVAEASKAIENAQRDVNISFVNELALIFDRIGIDTNDVIDAAGTKWNFLKYKPGLVGGHCIGVDPYYLTYKSQKLGYDSQVILAGRVINDGMAAHVARRVLQHIIQNTSDVKNAKVLVMGATFKENVSDIRNSKVADIIKELKSYSLQVHVTDPYANSNELNHEYGFELTPDLANDYAAVIVTVPHNDYIKMDDNSFSNITKPEAIIADLKGIYRGKISSRSYWSL